MPEPLNESRAKQLVDELVALLLKGNQYKKALELMGCTQSKMATAISIVCERKKTKRRSCLDKKKMYIDHMNEKIEQVETFRIKSALQKLEQGGIPCRPITAIQEICPEGR